MSMRTLKVIEEAIQEAEDRQREVSAFIARNPQHREMYTTQYRLIEENITKLCAERSKLINK